MPDPRTAWRGLGIFWLATVLLMGAGGLTLQVLGPPVSAAPPPEERAEAGVATPAETPVEPAPTGAAAAPSPPPGIARPEPALLERSRGNPPLLLPRPGPEGRMARTAYAAPLPPVPPGARRVALLLGSFGASEPNGRAILGALPGPVSLAVSAYAATAATPLLNDARAAGHELFAAVPMEPDGYPLNDEGPRSLRAALSPEENRANLEWALAQTPGAVGATGASDGMRGERFAGLPASLDPAVDEVLRRGLLYLDPRPGASTRPGLPIRSVDVVLDDSAARAEIEARLLALERVAAEKGSAIGLVNQPRPVTLSRLSAWVASLPSRNLVLVPVSSLFDLPAHPAPKEHRVE